MWIMATKCIQTLYRNVEGNKMMDDIKMEPEEEIFEDPE